MKILKKINKKSDCAKYRGDVRIKPATGLFGDGDLEVFITDYEGGVTYLTTIHKHELDPTVTIRIALSAMRTGLEDIIKPLRDCTPDEMGEGKYGLMFLLSL